MNALPHPTQGVVSRLLGVGVVALCFWTGAEPVSGQERLSLTALAGISAPVGEFGDELGDDAGLAQMGFTLAADLIVPIRPVTGLGWISTLEGATFAVDEDFVSELSLAEPEAQIDIGRYWTGLFFTGLRYVTGVTEGLDVYGVGQLGAGYFRAPGATITLFGETADLETSWKLAKGLAAGIGASVNDRFIVDARFVTLINTEIEGELTYQGITETLEGEQPVKWVQVMVGVRIP